MENFSDAVQNAIQNAFQKAKVNDNPEVTENHLLLSFLEDPQGYFHTLLDETKGNTQQLISDLNCDEPLKLKAHIASQGGLLWKIFPMLYKTQSKMHFKRPRSMITLKLQKTICFYPF